MMGMTYRRIGILCLLTTAVCLGCDRHTTTGPTGVQKSSGERRLFSTPDVDELLHTLPMVAVWTDSTGFSAQPSLRVALWDDGRVLFAINDGEPNSTLRFRHISRDTTKQLKHDIRKTGLFELKGHRYLVHDASVMCLLATVYDYKQLLYWDEVVSPNYGINIDPKPHHHDFINAWKSANDLALTSISSESVPIEYAFRAPESWYVKRAIQSE